MFSSLLIKLRKLKPIERINHLNKLLEQGRSKKEIDEILREIKRAELEIQNINIREINKEDKVENREWKEHGEIPIFRREDETVEEVTAPREVSDLEKVVSNTPINEEKKATAYGAEGSYFKVYNKGYEGLKEEQKLGDVKINNKEKEARATGYGEYVKKEVTPKEKKGSFKSEEVIEQTNKYYKGEE